MKSKIILNLGGGELPIKGAIGVDAYKGKYIDEVVNLTRFPWKWKSNSVDGIYLIHTLEHLPEPVKILRECHRILKRGGFLYIQVPHSSNICAIGDMTHYRTFSLPTIGDILTQASWVNPKALFVTKIQRIIWWDTRHRNHPYLHFLHNSFKSKRPWLDSVFILPLASLIQVLIDLSPSFFERIWAHYVGGADEVIWKGEKI